METNMISKGVFTMRKFLLVVFIGMVLAINLYGCVTEIMSKVEVDDAKDEVGTVVYYVE